jgi:hypothetical protein
MNAGIPDLEMVFFSCRKIYGPTAAKVNRRMMIFPQKKEPLSTGALLIKKIQSRINYFFAVFLTIGFMAAFFFGAAATAFFLEATGPLFIIGSSQQIISAAAQPHSSSTITASPHTSQLNKSPAFTLAISYPPRH